jgi:hypothetical protein
MIGKYARSLTLALLLCASVGGCADEPTKPTKSQNRNPVIQTLIAFPTAIGPGDSTLVMCNATDPDGDALVYDWITDSRLVIQGKQAADHALYDSPSSSHVFYHGPWPGLPDSAWVQCIVRDHKGGADGRLITILVNQ